MFVNNCTDYRQITRPVIVQPYLRSQIYVIFFFFLIIFDKIKPNVLSVSEHTEDNASSRAKSPSPGLVVSVQEVTSQSRCILPRKNETNEGGCSMQHIYFFNSAHFVSLNAF